MVIIQKQSNNRHSGRIHNHQEQKKARQGPEFNKEHAHYFFHVKGIVRHEFVPPNTTVNSDFYCDVLTRLRENVRQKRPELWCNHNWLLHHDSAPAHASLKTTEFVTKNNMVIIPCPPYSPHLATSHFALFPKLKMKVKGHFDTVSDIQRELQAVLVSIKENEFYGAFEAWKK
jgi:transposase